MKKIISKIRNKRLKGNVSLLVIFILLASSVIALLSINQIQRLLTYWNMTFNYFRAFYLAKAGTELWLTEVYYREAWFEQTIDSWNAIVTENLVWVYSGFNPYFTMNISWNFLHLTDDVRYTDKCDENNKITLGTWEWIMLSLFTDETEWFSKILSSEENDTIIQELKNEEIENLKSDSIWDFTFWIFAYNDWNMADIIVKTWNNLINFLNNLEVSKFLDTYEGYPRKYLTIKNSWDEPISFCISWRWYIPYSDSLITVRGNYGDMEVWLQSVVKKEVPSWSLDVLWWQE